MKIPQGLPKIIGVVRHHSTFQTANQILTATLWSHQLPYPEAKEYSEYSKRTLEYAASLAEKCQAELIVVTVINQRDVDFILKVADKTFDRTIERNVEKLADDYVKRETEKRTRQIEKLIEEISCIHLAVKKIVRVGVPFQELTRTIENEKVDLMVVGPKGRGNIAGVLLGSNAEKLFRHCPVPLLSVRYKISMDGIDR